MPAALEPDLAGRLQQVRQRLRRPRQPDHVVHSVKTLLVVVYTFREDAIRLISARQATSQERNSYEDEPAS
jgi:uncharacterized DUF497 family protein